jgi:hypothetical protein
LNPQNENFIAKVYDISWNELNIDDQKMLQFILLKASEEIQLSFIVGTLNFETFVSVRSSADRVI